MEIIILSLVIVAIAVVASTMVLGRAGSGKEEFNKNERGAGPVKEGTDTHADNEPVGLNIGNH